MDKTTIQLDNDVREQLRGYQLPDESANDAVKRLLSESEPPQLGVDEAQAENIARRVVNEELDKMQTGSRL